MISEGEGESTADRIDAALRGVLGMAARRPPLALAPGVVVDDAYRIERLLGAGGMGVVHLARDLRLERDVAIKLHTAVAGEPGGERLIREARAMARLTHPNVATVHEVGTWAGHPYVVMEHVDGGTARSWLETPRSPAEILALYLAAARGLAAAHAAGFVHRDFKPDNVLVGRDGRVRVADFGIACARARDDAPDAPATVTRPGARMGTPAYMAPEQRRGEAVGPAADQFAFAVALWEALAGARPFADVATTDDAADAAPVAVIGEPPRGRIRPRIRAVLARALAADPAARWPSLDALIAALERAQPRGRRRRGVALVMLAALAAGGGAAWMARAHDRGDACRGAGDAIARIWSPERRVALEAAFRATGRPFADHAATRVGARLDAYTAAWSTARMSSCALGATSRELRARRDHCLDRRRDDVAALVGALTTEVAPEAVDRAVELAFALPDLADCADPAGADASPRPGDAGRRAELQRIETRIAEARALHGVGRFADGRAAAEDAVARADAVADPRLAGEARYWLGFLVEDTGEAAEVRAIFDAAARHAARAGDDVLVAQIWLGQLGELVVHERAFDRAAPFVAVAEAAVARAGAPPRQRAELDSLIASMRAGDGHPAEAVTRLERALATLEGVVLPGDPALASTLNRLGNAYREAGRDDDARAVYERAERLLLDAYGPEHPNLARVRNNLATLRMLSGDLDGARTLLEQVVAAKERLLGADHSDLAGTLINLGSVHLQLGRLRDARAALERADRIARARLGPDHPATALAASTLADVELASGELDAARGHLAAALAAQERTLGPESRDVGQTLIGLAEVERQRGDAAAARRAIDRARRIVAKFGPDDLDAALVAITDGDILVLERRRGEAIDALRSAAALTERVYQPGDLHVAQALGSLGAALLDAGDREGARAAFERAVAISEAKGATLGVAEARFALATALPASERARAIELVTAARAAWAAAGLDVARADAWLGATARSTGRGPSPCTRRARRATTRRASPSPC